MHNSLIPSDSVHHVSIRPLISDASEKRAEPIIWIVGTDAETRLLYRLFLELRNFKIVEANCFNELVAIVEHLQPELILMDGTFSFEDDLETIRQIRCNRLLRRTPLILTSGHSQAKVRDLVMQSGADAFLVKPLNYDELTNTLSRNIAETRHK